MLLVHGLLFGVPYVIVYIHLSFFSYALTHQHRVYPCACNMTMSNIEIMTRMNQLEAFFTQQLDERNQSLDKEFQSLHRRIQSLDKKLQIQSQKIQRLEDSTAKLSASNKEMTATSQHHSTVLMPCAPSTRGA
ncbi:hypothetical protein C8R48DRAFT_194234 [Suillus tomentosus]|nr:hypothetical protein C8R48DRAFT_194234 [Suillus tomentosus]